MTDVVLTEGQWALDGFVFGRGTDINVARFDFGDPDLRTTDQPAPREDGIRFGRDYRGGRVVSIEGNVLAAGYEVLDRVAQLEAAWDSECVRTVPGETSVLSWCRGGQTRRAYGRARRFAPTTDLDWAGNVPFVAEFVTVDHLFYDDARQVETIGFVPAPAGGLVGPLVGPLVGSGTGSALQTVTVGGTRPAWATCVLRGPITDPIIEITDRWAVELDLTLQVGQWMLIDPSPWSRYVRRDDTANLAGALTARSARLTEMRLPPGLQQVVLRGVDPTGTSTLQLYWRPAHASY